MDDFDNSGYSADDVTAALAYPGFGMYDDSTDDGSIAPLMFGLDIDTFIGDTPSTAPTRYEFSASITESASLSVQYNRFQIVDAYFKWTDRSLTITSDLAACTCLNC